MTKAQRIALQADWWPKACRAQGWKTTDRDLRLRVCMWAISLTNPTQAELLEAISSDREPLHQIESTNDLNNKEDVDKVKACLGMLADNLKSTVEIGRPQLGAARRKRDIIRSHLKCLALFEAHPRRYLATLVNDMFDHGRKITNGAPTTIKDLTDDVQIYFDRKTREPYEGPSQLERLMMRLAQVVNDARNKNELTPAYRHLQGLEPLTIHEMKLTAGVFCACTICAKLRAHGHAPILPPLPIEENWSDFDPELETVTDEFGGDGGQSEGDPF